MAPTRVRNSSKRQHQVANPTAYKYREVIIPPCTHLAAHHL